MSWAFKLDSAGSLSCVEIQLLGTLYNLKEIAANPRERLPYDERYYSWRCVDAPRMISYEIVSKRLQAAGVDTGGDVEYEGNILKQAFAVHGSICRFIYAARSGGDPDLTANLDLKRKIAVLTVNLSKEYAVNFYAMLYKFFSYAISECEGGAALLSVIRNALKLDEDTLRKTETSSSKSVNYQEGMEGHQACLSRLVDLIGINDMCFSVDMSTKEGVFSIMPDTFSLGGRVKEFEKRGIDIDHFYKELAGTYIQARSIEMNSKHDRAFWKDDESRRAFVSLYLSLVGLAHCGSDPTLGADALLPLYESTRRAVVPEQIKARAKGRLMGQNYLLTELLINMLPEQARAYRRAMPMMTPEILSEKLAPDILKDTDSHDEWKSTEKLARYLANILASYMRSDPPRPTHLGSYTAH